MKVQLLLALLLTGSAQAVYLDSCSVSQSNIVVTGASPVVFNLTLVPPTRFEVSHFGTKNLRSPNGVLFGSGQSRLTPNPLDTEQHDLYLAQAVVPGAFNNSAGDLLLHYKPMSSKGGSEPALITVVLPLVGVTAGQPTDTHVERTLQNILGITSRDGGAHIFNPFQFISTGDTLYTFESKSALYPCKNDATSGRHILHSRAFRVLSTTLDFIESKRKEHEDYVAWGVSTSVVSALSWTAEVTGYHLARPDAPSASALLPANSTIGNPLIIKHRMQEQADILAMQSVAVGLGAGALALVIYVSLLLAQRQRVFCRWYEQWGESKKKHGKQRAPETQGRSWESESEEDDEE